MPEKSRSKVEDFFPGEISFVYFPHMPANERDVLMEKSLGKVDDELLGELPESDLETTDEFQKAVSDIPGEGEQLLKAAARVFETARGESPDMEMVQEAVSRLKKVRSEARTPNFDSTETKRWGDVSKDLSNFIDGYIKHNDVEEPEEGWNEAGDLPQQAKQWIASKTLLGDSEADNADDLIYFPVVNPSTNDLNLGALNAILGGRGAQADISDSALSSARNKVETLKQENFKEEMEKNLTTLSSMLNQANERYDEQEVLTKTSEKIEVDQETLEQIAKGQIEDLEDEDIERCSRFVHKIRERSDQESNDWDIASKQKGKAGDDTGPTAREIIDTLQDLGASFRDISKALDSVNPNFEGDITRSASALSSISEGEIENPPRELLSALSQISDMSFEKFKEVTMPDPEDITFSEIQKQVSKIQKSDKSPEEIIEKLDWPEKAKDHLRDLTNVQKTDDGGSDGDTTGDEDPSAGEGGSTDSTGSKTDEELEKLRKQKDQLQERVQKMEDEKKKHEFVQKVEDEMIGVPGDAEETAVLLKSIHDAVDEDTYDQLENLVKQMSNLVAESEVFEKRTDQAEIGDVDSDLQEEFDNLTKNQDLSKAQAIDRLVEKHPEKKNEIEKHFV
jgi:hypothetical protein